jgi:hypothetical protein
MDKFPSVQETENDISKASEDERKLLAAEAVPHKDRSSIARWVILLYCCVVAAAVLYLLFRGIWWGENVFDDISDLIKTAIVPIVTLVIGYYFGVAKSE